MGASERGAGVTVIELGDLDGRAIVVRAAGAELFRYVYVPDAPQLEAPKPYFHPIRTRAGNDVALYRPHDHVWHKGISWALPVVGEENFWGGPTYIHGRFYVQLDNDGTQRHLETVRSEVEDDVATFAHRLEWIAQAGAVLFREERAITARLLPGDDAWLLTFSTEMTNVSLGPISLGSPGTKGRENAGYAGLFWRGPRSFTGGQVVAPGVSGSGDDLRGQRHEWMGFTGEHDGVDAASSVVIVDDVQNPRHPPQWFARSSEFACLNPAPFFEEELVIDPGQQVRFTYAVAVADSGAERMPQLAALARSVLAQ